MYVYDLERLEYRQRGRHLLGTFRYGAFATMRDRGRERKETISPRAFTFAVESEDHDIDLLRGHAFDSPLASKLAGTLVLVETNAALEFDAELPPERSQPSWMVDTVLAVRSGLIKGISPGFRVPPLSVVPNAEELVPETGNPNILVRRVNHAVLYEISLVTRPGYTGTEIDIRQAERGVSKMDSPNLERFYRWL